MSTRNRRHFDRVPNEKFKSETWLPSTGWHMAKLSLLAPRSSNLWTPLLLLSLLLLTDFFTSYFALRPLQFGALRQLIPSLRFWVNTSVVHMIAIYDLAIVFKSVILVRKLRVLFFFSLRHVDKHDKSYVSGRIWYADTDATVPFRSVCIRCQSQPTRFSQFAYKKITHTVRLYRKYVVIGKIFENCFNEIEVNTLNCY